MAFEHYHIFDLRLVSIFHSKWFRVSCPIQFNSGVETNCHTGNNELVSYVLPTFQFQRWHHFTKFKFSALSVAEFRPIKFLLLSSHSWSPFIPWRRSNARRKATLENPTCVMQSSCHEEITSTTISAKTTSPMTTRIRTLWF